MPSCLQSGISKGGIFSARLGHIGTPPAFAATRFSSTPCPIPSLQSFGNTGLGNPRDNADFVFFKIGRQQEHWCFWLVAANRIQARHQSIAVAGHIHASNHKSSRLWNQLTGVINGLVTAARSRRLPKLFGAVTKRNQSPP